MAKNLFFLIYALAEVNVPARRHGPLCHIFKKSGTGVHHINS